MSTTAESLFKVLLELSSNPTLVGTRENFLASNTHAGRQTLFNDTIGDDLLRWNPNKLLLAMFDIAAEEQKARAREEEKSADNEMAAVKGETKIVANDDSTMRNATRG